MPYVWVLWIVTLVTTLPYFLLLRDTYQHTNADDGRLTNTGSQTVSGITVQVFFRNDEGMPPHLETIPIALIRTRQPYVDTQPISADPLKPGDQREFRLIFESIPDNWNTQLPELHTIAVSTR